MRRALHGIGYAINYRIGEFPDDIYNEVLTCFGEKEIIDLTMAIITINSWNRIAVSFRKLPS
ncbi:hypothetical protein DGG96_02255 [Legionella qingyii]|uniref:Uncharacterized protein n=1 Tax=Legionella qingyii TaxID=2184757 RepID=A0A317U9A2_9GAMM|nr:hypothetical protein DGG96_06935 [Legionella qingyii]PWY57152.1 hypothetical protein DGG96_02255 [Legionella qingyii]RUR25008.1 hypothetical protein ELY20_04420 [Legionella qingyii]